MSWMYVSLPSARLLINSIRQKQVHEKTSTTKTTQNASLSYSKIKNPINHAVILQKKFYNQKNSTSNSVLSIQNHITHLTFNSVADLTLRLSLPKAAASANAPHNGPVSRSVRTSHNGPTRTIAGILRRNVRGMCR